MLELDYFMSFPQQAPVSIRSKLAIILTFSKNIFLWVVSHFYLGVDFKVFLRKYFFFKAMLENIVILTQLEKMVLPITPLFDLGVDFYVFYAKIWVLRARFLILRS
jgi:uncharacterized membrane protein YvlD (DUF360 family)